MSKSFKYKMENKPDCPMTLTELINQLEDIGVKVLAFHDFYELQYERKTLRYNRDNLQLMKWEFLLFMSTIMIKRLK